MKVRRGTALYLDFRVTRVGGKVVAAVVGVVFPLGGEEGGPLEGVGGRMCGWRGLVRCLLVLVQMLAAKAGVAVVAQKCR